MSPDPGSLSQKRLLELVEEVAPRPAGGIGPDTLLVDMGLDSIAFAELNALLQEGYGIDLADADTPRISTAGELADLVMREAGRTGDGTGTERIPAGIGRRQRAAEGLLGPLLRWWFDVEVEGASRMPSDGPVVLAMNHESLLDIPVAVLASSRPITFMAKRELFRSAAAARFFQSLGGFSVDRHSFDTRAVEIALAVLRRGGVLGMYPEGTRKPGELLPFLPGAAWVALRTGAMLLPAAVSGSGKAMPRGQKIPRRVPIRFRFGEPIVVEAVDDPAKRREEAERLTDELRASVEALWE